MITKNIINIKINRNKKTKKYKPTIYRGSRSKTEKYDYKETCICWLTFKLPLFYKIDFV